MDFNKIKEMGLEYAEKGRNAAMDLAERGRTQAKIVSEQTKLARAQRQLGALVYSLAKGNEENQPLVDKYIEMIGSIGPPADLDATRTGQQAQRAMVARLPVRLHVERQRLAQQPGRGQGVGQVIVLRRLCGARNPSAWRGRRRRLSFRSFPSGGRRKTALTPARSRAVGE